MVIYPVDSVIQLSNNPGQADSLEVRAVETGGRNRTYLTFDMYIAVP